MAKQYNPEEPVKLKYVCPPDKFGTQNTERYKESLPKSVKDSFEGAKYPITLGEKSAIMPLRGALDIIRRSMAWTCFEENFNALRQQIGDVELNKWMAKEGLKKGSFFSIVHLVDADTK